jgi:hypothetical protein
MEERGHGGVSTELHRGDARDKGAPAVALESDKPSATEKYVNAKDGVSPQNRKKPYGKPTFRFERVFETMALSCGKRSPVEGICRFNRRNS